MARALGLLFFAGAVIGLASLALPHPAKQDQLGIATACAIALLVGLALTFERGRLPSWTFATSCFGATVLIGFAIYYSSQADSAYSFYFVLVTMFAAYFLSARQLVAQTLWIA